MRLTHSLLVLGLIGLVALIATSFHTTAYTSSYVVTVPGNLYTAFAVNVDNGLAIVAYASNPITFLVMTPSQFSALQSGASPKGVYSVQGQSFDVFLNLPAGQYYLVFYNNLTSSGTQVSYFAASRPAPTGLADYGLQYSGGVLTPYTLTFDRIVGSVNILGTTTGYNVGSSSRAYSIQLNAVIYASTSNGSQELWAQNVAIIDGGNMYFAVNLWNFTSPNANIYSNEVSGKGSLITYNGRSLYAYATPYLPFNSNFQLVMNVKQTLANQFVVSFGYSLGGSVYWFDNVTVTLNSNVNSVYFMVSGSQMTGDHHAFDAELVLGGYSSGLNYNFTSANVALNMYYGSYGQVIYPKTTYMFGVDTAEGAYNLYTSQNGVVQVGYSYYPYVTTQGTYAPLRISHFSYSNYVDSAKPYLQLNLSVTGGTYPYTVNLVVTGPFYNQTFQLNYYQTSSGWVTFTVPLTGVKAGNYFAKLIVKDSSGISVTKYFNFTVVPPPNVTVKVNPSEVVVNQKVAFYANVTGGAPPITVIWLVNGTQVGSGYALTYSFSKPGVYNVTAVATDSWGVRSLYSVVINVLPPLAVQIITPLTTVDVNVSLTLYAKVLSGSPPYNFTWLVNGKIVGHGQNVSLAFQLPGKYNVTVKVYSRGLSAFSSIIVKVNPPLALRVPSNVTAEQGVPISLKIDVTNGTPPYKVFVNGTLTNSVNLTITPKTVGLSVVNVTVVDSGGGKVTELVHIYVVPHVKVNVVAPYKTIDQGYSLVLTANVTGGKAPYSIVWLVNGETFYNVTSVKVTGTYLGNVSVTVIVTDSLGGTSTSNATLSVVPKPVVALRVPNVTDVGLKVQIAYDVSYGTPPYSIKVLVNGSPVSGPVSFSSPGTYVVKVIVSDAYNATASATAPITVNPGLQVQVSAPGEVDVGIPFNLTYSVSGGTRPYSVAFLLNGTPISPTDVKLPSEGIYNLTIVVRDSVGAEAMSFATVKAVKPPTLKLIYVTGSSFLVTNSSVSVTPVVSGGVKPVVYVYLNGQLATTVNPNASVTLSLQPGTNEIRVVVKDAYGLEATQRIIVNTAYNTLNIGGIVGTVALVAAVAVAVLKFRKP
ncbi:MAG: thermopsin family protease [Thermoprotei archaeon]